MRNSTAFNFKESFLSAKYVHAFSNSLLLEPAFSNAASISFGYYFFEQLPIAILAIVITVIQISNFIFLLLIYLQR